MTEKFDRLDVNRSIDLQPKDHEVWFSFYDDFGAECFLDWWRFIGAELFNEYYKEQK